MQPPGLFSITFYTEQFWWKQDNLLILTKLAQFCVGQILTLLLTVKIVILMSQKMPQEFD